MAALAPPSSQRATDRPIAFLIDDQVSGVGPVEALSLYVRPEDLTRQEPSRVNIIQTLNSGAWADSWGPGVSMITLSGTTGWRRDADSGNDGEARFQELRSRVFQTWHDRRQRAVQALRDPSGVNLIFSDALDDIVATVAPISFTLRRSRSRPLLLQYQIQLAVLADGVRSPYMPAGSISPSAKVGLGLDSLFSTLKTIQNLAGQAKDFVDRNILGPVQQFTALTQSVLTVVTATVDAVMGVPASLLSVAKSVSAAGANLFRTISAVAGIPDRVAGYMIEMASAFTNAWCLLNNALSAPETYQEYSPLRGASNCSSTAGGEGVSRFAGQNSFSYIAPPPKPPVVSVSSSAQASLSALADSDVALRPMSPPEAAAHASAIASGVKLA